MAANVETMFSVREVPWHGLGTIIQEAPTSADALHMAGLDWEVLPTPLFANGNQVPGYQANIRSSDNSVLGIVSDKYKIVQNKQAFDFTDNLIGGDVKYETAGSLKNGHTVWMLAKLPQEKILGDAFDPYLCFTNTHDGTGAIRVCMTPIRVVCNNTLNVALRHATRMWSTRHMGNIEAKMAEAKRTLELAGEYQKQLAKEAEDLANMTMTDDDIKKTLDMLLTIKGEESERKTKNAEEAKEQITACMFAPDLQKFLNTKWGFLNAVSDYVGHREPNRNTISFQENNWGKIIEGHPLFDKAYELITAK